MDRLFELVEAFAARLTGLKFDPETSLSDRHRGNLIGLYGIIGITIFSLFSVFRFLAGDVGGAVVDIIGVVSMLTLVFYLKRTGDVATRSSRLLMAVLYLLVCSSTSSIKCARLEET